MGKERLPVKLTLTAPQITEAGKKLAMEIVKATMILEIDGKKEPYLVSELTPDLVKKDAERIADLENVQQRASELFGCMWTGLRLVADCQALATEFVHIADELHTLGKQLEAMQHIVVQKMERKDDPDSKDA